MRNPLTQVTGPEFLGLFAILIVAVAALLVPSQVPGQLPELPPLEPPTRSIRTSRVPASRAERSGSGADRGAYGAELSPDRKPESKWWNLFRKISASNRRRITRTSASCQQSSARLSNGLKVSPDSGTGVSEGAKWNFDGLAIRASHTHRKVRAESPDKRLLTTEELQNEARWNVSLGIALVAMIGLHQAVHRYLPR